MSKKINFKTFYAEKNVKGESFTQPSMTIPDQTMSIPELIKRYASGLPLGGSRVPLYEENPEEDILGGRPFASYDLSEQNNFVKQAKQDYYDKLQAHENAIKQAEFQKFQEEPKPNNEQ